MMNWLLPRSTLLPFKRFQVWGPSLFYMAVIVYFSHRHAMLEEVAGSLNFSGIDKVAHFFEFGLLYLLLYRSFVLEDSAQPSRKAVIVSLLFALSDEVHQAFLPYRECQLSDLFADSLGVMFTFKLAERLRNYLPWTSE